MGSFVKVKTYSKLTVKPFLSTQIKYTRRPCKNVDLTQFFLFVCFGLFFGGVVCFFVLFWLAGWLAGWMTLGKVSAPQQLHLLYVRT